MVELRDIEVVGREYFVQDNSLVVEASSLAYSQIGSLEELEFLVGDIVEQNIVDIVAIEVEQMEKRLEDKLDKLVVEQDIVDIDVVDIVVLEYVLDM